jgi:hypothetical protein
VAEVDVASEDDVAADVDEVKAVESARPPSSRPKASL